MIRVHTRTMPLGSDVDVAELAARWAGGSGADIEERCRAAAMRALRRGLSSQGGTAAAAEVRRADFLDD